MSKQNDEVFLSDNIILTDSDNKTIDIIDLFPGDCALFFWFSDKCCHSCVEKEVKRLERLSKSNIVQNIVFIMPKRPIRTWGIESKAIIQTYSIVNDIYCLSNLYSLTDNESEPYYFVYNKQRNTISHVFLS